LGLEEGSGKRESVSLFTFAPGSKKPMSKAQSGNSAYINTSWKLKLDSKAQTGDEKKISQ